MNIKNYILVSLLFITAAVFAQLEVPFAPRLSSGNVKVKGDIVLIGNNIISSSTTPNSAYNGNLNNDLEVGSYIDVDTDSGTFSSSTANLNIAASCRKIVYAGLYWSATYPHENGVDATSFINLSSTRQNDWNSIKFRVPSGTYVDLTADNNPDPAGDEARRAGWLCLDHGHVRAAAHGRHARGGGVAELAPPASGLATSGSGDFLER